jgi:ankyrin repeat protein
MIDDSPRNAASTILLQDNLPVEDISNLSGMRDLSDWIDKQAFLRLHRLVTGLTEGDLAEQLRYSPDSVNALDKNGRTPLHWAASRGSIVDCVTLLEFGADPNILDMHWLGPVAYSANWNHHTCTRILLEAGAHADVETTRGYKMGSPLNRAARNATDPLLIKTLLEFGANVDATDLNENTALIHAARADKVDFAHILLEHGANINFTTNTGHTPLTTALQNNSHGVLELLLGHWKEQDGCPRTKEPNLLDIVAKYADPQSMLLLVDSTHLKTKCSLRFPSRDFERLLNTVIEKYSDEQA